MAYMLRGKLNMLLYVVVCMFAGTLVGGEGRHGGLDVSPEGVEDMATDDGEPDEGLDCGKVACEDACDALERRVGELLCNVCEECINVGGSLMHLYVACKPGVDGVSHEERQKKIREHTQSLFGSGTRGGTDMRKRDWDIYLRIAYKEEVPLLGEMLWPPGREEWLEFMSKARPMVSSYKRFATLLANVANVGSVYYARQRNVLACTFDPRKLHAADSKKLMQALKREYGVGVRQVMGITMQEARSGPNFVDGDSVLGCAQGAAWTIGTVMGGRRPRSLTSVRLKDVQLIVCRMTVAGRTVLVPGIESISWRDEKTHDYAGQRQSSDVYHDMDEEDWVFVKQRPAYWVYRLLVMRGVVEGGDPLGARGVQPGMVIAMKKCAEDYYLLCDCAADEWCDTMPVSVQILGNWTRQILQHMGRPRRGYSAHRRGCVTRAVILDMLHNQGRCLSEDTLLAVCRWGGVGKRDWCPYTHESLCCQVCGFVP